MGILPIKGAYSIVGEETALMIELVATTIGQLNELEKLVTNAEKYTERVQKYNELAEDKYFQAGRILYLAEELAAKKEIEDLGDLNMVIRDLKYTMADLKDQLKEVRKIKNGSQKYLDYSKVETKLVNKRKKVAENQVLKSSKARKASRANQLTAQNTALILENQARMHETQLKVLENAAKTNKLLGQELEDIKKKEIERRKYYGWEQEL
jgi:hypothetical protein